MVPRLMGLFAVIPASILLTLGFFVLLVLRKTEEKALKILGSIALVFLLTGSTLIVLSGVHTLMTGKCLMMKMMQAKQGMMCKGMMAGPMMNKQEMMEKELLIHKMKMKEREQMMGNQGIMEKEELLNRKKKMMEMDNE